MRLPALLILLAACGADAVQSPPVLEDPVVPATTAPTVDHERLESDAAYTLERLHAVTAHVAALPATEQRTVRDTMSFLVANCPYTRAQVTTVLTMARTLDSVDLDAVPESERAQVTALIEAMHAEVAFFQASGADALLPPIPGDYLYGVVPALSGEDLARADDPVAFSFEALARVDAAVSAMPRQTQEGLWAAWDQVNPYTGANALVTRHEDHIEAAIEDLSDEATAALGPVPQLMAELSSKGC